MIAALHGRWLLACVLVACNGNESNQPSVASSASARTVPVDRLAPGELQPGKEQAYGLVLPRGMTIIRRFSESIHAAGPLRQADVANYVRKRVNVYRVELGAAGTIFPDAKILSGDRNRTYRIIVSAQGPKHSKLHVEDVTPPPKVEGLSEAERWRRAGVDPKTGRLLNPEQAE